MSYEFGHFSCFITRVTQIFTWIITEQQSEFIILYIAFKKLEKLTPPTVLVQEEGLGWVL